MREIEFRGKSCDEWVYGHLLKTEKDEVCCVNCESKHSNYLIQTDELDKYNEYGKYYITDDDTIGQYTGMKDKNGVKIFEGDIILTQPLRDKPFSQKAKTKRLKAIVKYIIKDSKNFIDEPNKVRYWGAGFDVEIIDKKDYAKYCNCEWGLFFDCEVIGNVWDNGCLLNDSEKTKEN